MRDAPLAGKTVLVTRPLGQGETMCAALRALGAKAIHAPAIEFRAAERDGAFDAALRALAGFDWVVFTSVNGVHAVAERMDELSVPRKMLTSRRLAAVGPATAAALAEAFRAPDAVPTEFLARAILGVVQPVRRMRFLLPRADLASPELADDLRGAGATVEAVAAYHIVRPASSPPLPEETPDAIALTSSESVRATRDWLELQGKGHWMHESALACIGPLTAQAVRSLACEPALISRPHTSEALVQSIAQYLSARSGG